MVLDRRMTSSWVNVMVFCTVTVSSAMKGERKQPARRTRLVRQTSSVHRTLKQGSQTPTSSSRESPKIWNRHHCSVVELLPTVVEPARSAFVVAPRQGEERTCFIAPLDR